MKSGKKTSPPLKLYSIAISIAVFIVAIVEFLFGRIPICKCGYIKFWQGAIWSSENSQHLTDWYTFSHIIHGFGFYYLGKKVLKKYSMLHWVILALVIETGWEIIENSSFVINRYRDTTVSLDYSGDSIINSISDILAMVVGFYLAKKLPLWQVLVLTFLMEVIVGYLIRDNLTLNIIMLLYPFQSIKNWQMGNL